MNNSTRIPGLDLLRIIAIGMAVLAQCLWVFPNANVLLVQAAGVFHFLGLEIFFVLSGVLLYRNLYPLYIRGDFSWPTLGRFVRKRLLQIAPLYFLMLVLNFAFAAMGNLPIADGWKYVFFIQNFASPMPAFFEASWGLTIVLFANVLFPVVLCLMARFRKPKNKPLFFLIVTLLLIVVGLFLKLSYSAATPNSTLEHWDISVKAVVIYRLDSVFIGVLSGWLLANHEFFLNKIKFLLAGFGLLGIAFLFVGVGYFQLLIESHPLFWNVLYLPMTTIIIAFFLPMLYVMQTSQTLKRILVLGSRSTYAFYMINFGLLQPWAYAFFKHMSGTLITMIFFGLYIAGTFLLAIFIHKYYQRRFSGTQDVSTYFGGRM